MKNNPKDKLSINDLKNIKTMLEKLPVDTVMEYAYLKSVLDHNYNYSNIMQRLEIAIPILDEMLVDSDQVMLPIRY